MGGHGSKAKASASSALALSSIASWMSFVNANIPMGGDDLTQKVEDVMNQFQEYFTSHSFLASTALPSLADIDLFFTFMTILPKAGVTLTIGTPFARYMAAVDGRIEQLVTMRGIDFSWPRVSVGIPDPVPQFFYGNEIDLESKFVGASVEALKPATKSPGAGDDAAAASSKPNPTPEQIAAAEKRKAKKAEKAKKAANKPKGKPNQPAAELDISALELKVGQITKAWPHPDSEKLWCEEIDVGESEPRQILSGLRAFYKQADMDQARVVVLCNLKKKPLGGIPSHGMVLCASNADHSAVEFVIPPPGAKIGERVEFANVETVEAKPENQVAKKKLLEKLVVDLLKTNEEGVMVWKGNVSQTSDGPVVAAKGMKNAQVS